MGDVAHRSLRRVVVVVAALASVVAMAMPARAHASFVASSPSPGTSLPQAPAAVVLRFNEPLNAQLSHLEVVDRDGGDAADGPTEQVEGDAMAMRRPLALLTPGQYQVRWTTVSTVDGHTLHGSYTFGVATPTLGNEALAQSPVDSEGWLGLVGRLVALVGLSLWTGAVLLSAVAEQAGVVPARLRLVARAGPVLTLVGTAMSVLSSALVATGAFGDVTAVLASRSGRYRSGVLAAALVGSVTPVTARVSARVLAGLAVVAEAASGHAAATPAPALAIASFAAHLGAAGVWVVALIFAASTGDRLARALNHFTPHALRAAVVVALTGLLNTWLEVGSPSDLVQTGYGRVVVAKIVVLAVMVLLGVLHQRRRHAGDPVERLRRPLRAELVAAGVALVLATALVGYPNPPREEAEAHAVASGEPLLAGVDMEHAVSVAAASGEFVVALSLWPPEPGPVQVRVAVLGVDAGDGLREVAIEASTDDGAKQATQLDDCGLGCFEGTINIPSAGVWDFDVVGDSNRGPLGMQVGLPFPTPAAGQELQRALAAMEQLQTARVREELRASEGSELILSHYAFRAPDTLRFEVSGGRNTLIVIDDRGYRRSSPDGPWKVTQWPEPGYSWPQGYYGDFWAEGASAVRAIGHEEVDGVASTVVAFVRPEESAWFRLWVGEDDGLVRRMEMTAQGHLMTHEYQAFNTDVDIRPPEDVVTDG